MLVLSSWLCCARSLLEFQGHRAGAEGKGDWRSQEGSQLCVGLLQVLVEDTDQLWHNHCLRDFKNEKPEEFESWREMYLRLHDAREQRLLMLARNIGSAHANKPKGGADRGHLTSKPVQFGSC